MAAKRKRFIGHAIHVRRVSAHLLRQVQLEAEAADMTVRELVVETMCLRCGISPESEEVTHPGRKTRRQQAEEKAAEAERQARIDAWERRTTCRQPGHKDGALFICRLPRDHAGDCSPDPTPSPPSDPA